MQKYLYFATIIEKIIVKFIIIEGFNFFEKIENLKY